MGRKHKRNVGLRFALTVFIGVGLVGCNTETSPDVSAEAYGPAAQLSASCSGCHIKSNVSQSSATQGAIPGYDGWSSEQIKAQLLDYKQPGDTVMHRYMRGLSETDITLIADHLGAVETKANSAP